MSEGKPFIRSGQLFDCKNAYDYSPEIEFLFTDAMNEALRWHVTHCEVYKAFLSENGLIDFKTNYSTENIPPLLSDIFKYYSLISISEKLIKLKIKTNNKQLILDAKSHKRILKIYENIFNSLALTDYKQKVNYICLTSDSKNVQKSSNNFYYDLLTDLTAHRSVYYAFKPDNKNNELNFNVEETAKKIIDFSCHNEPIRIIGPSVFLFHVINWFEEHGIDLKLGKKSYCFILNNSEDSIKYNLSEDTLKNNTEKYLGISKENYRKIFILPEQGIPLVSCKCGRLHLPIYTKALILEPESLTPLQDGESGLLNLITPYLTSYPAISVLTNYKAVLEQNCPCGLNGTTLKILDICNDKSDDSF